jgi:hypothetical protein
MTKNMLLNTSTPRPQGYPYLDQGSRAGGEGSNLRHFDDEAIQVFEDLYQRSASNQPIQRLAVVSS